MNKRTILLLVTAGVFFVFFAFGCDEPVSNKQLKDFEPEFQLGTTIGSLAEVLSYQSVPVEGYGIVGGLYGTGSSECPVNLRNYLRRYILKSLPSRNINIDEFINSKNTAVVKISGRIPAAAGKNQVFDLKITPLEGTQTTSLENGWLYGAELKQQGVFVENMRTLARAEGPVFIDKLSTTRQNSNEGYILAGGIVLSNYNTSLILRKPDYLTATRIRNRLIERFGENSARALSEGQIALEVPAAYRNQKQRFVSIVRATFIEESKELNAERVNAYANKLVISDDKYESEIALEAIGKQSIDKLEDLIKLSDENVRLSAGRCLLNLGDDRGYKVLREIALDKGSEKRSEALRAIYLGAKRNDATSLARRLLKSQDRDMMLEAYNVLRRLEDVTIISDLIARNFHLEQIPSSSVDRKLIYATRSGRPRVVAFGAPIKIKDVVFIQSADGSITLNSSKGENFISIIYKHPKLPDSIIKVQSSLDLEDLIKKLSEEPVKKTKTSPTGLNIAYSDIIVLLKEMCEKGAIEADFLASDIQIN